MPELAYLNGEFMAIEEAMVPVEDRGLQFGDSLYEVVRLYGGEPFRLGPHLDRMRRGAEVIGMDLAAAGDLDEIMQELALRSNLDTAFLYLQVTRGVCPRNHLIPEDLDPTVIATARKLEAIPEEKYSRGSVAFTRPDLRWARRDVKATTLLPNIMSRSEAIKRGGYDAVHYEEDGTITEGSVSNFFCVIDGVIRTHPANERILSGISRATVLECAEDLDIPYRESPFSIDELMEDATEAFFSDTYSEVMPVTHVDGEGIGDGAPGPIAQRLRAAFRDVVRRETGSA